MAPDDDADPALFYTGLVAEAYRALRAVAPDPERYARFIAETGEPALELGCGDGDPLLDLRRRGLDVEGVDASLDMVERCRRRAADLGLDVTVHHQRMEQLDLGRRYRSIFLAGPTFNLLPDDDTARRSLERIRDHLDEDGTALVPLFVPPPVTPEEIGRTRETTDPAGTTLRFTITGVERDDGGRRQQAMTRYERLAGDDHTVLERPWVLHWHTPSSFGALAADAGLRTRSVNDAAGAVATDDATAFTFRLGLDG